MDISNRKYSDFALCREMLETADIFRQYNLDWFPDFTGKNRILLTGEGSSRIFPSKQALYRNLKQGAPIQLHTEGATQAMEYDLQDWAVLGASNSGKTRELTRLFQLLRRQNHSCFFGISAHGGTLLEQLATGYQVLSCGPEKAVAATKSVAEQALYIQRVLSRFQGNTLSPAEQAGDQLEQLLTMKPDRRITEILMEADTVYFAGRNDGVAEELSLKTNEIIRKRSSFLEGTFLLHGIEEVLSPSDAIILVEPFEEEEEKIIQCLGDKVGVKLAAISTRETRFPTFRIPENEDFQGYLQLAAGWNLLVEAGVTMGIDLDKPLRARKVGNQF